ncbi:MAG: gamma-glutamyltranspeptidase/glutathione hydrolase [Oceanicoccus sp.]|jgi:gamma-glutamyltranspeptidase/glutathione hydrolase
MAVTANPYATEAANTMLSKGGSATDAATPEQLVLTLVEPQSLGIGGGAFLMHWDTRKKQTQLSDGRETAQNRAVFGFIIASDTLYLDKRLTLACQIEYVSA